MSLLIPENLELPFFKTSENTLKQLQEALVSLKDEFSNYNPDLNDEVKSIPIGSRVLVTYDNGTTIEGRVWSVSKSNIYQVNRDGYKTYMNFPISNLKNLSTGYLGILERNIWLHEQNIISYQEILTNAQIPEILTDSAVNVIEVIHIESFYLFDVISFILSTNLRSGKVKLPKNVIPELGYYEFEVLNNEIVAVNKSSKMVFEKKLKY